jgi:iron complex transport system permease protein
MGEDFAHGLGIDVSASRRLLIFFASMTAAAAVSVSGVIGFVGLIVPHAMRMLLGPAHRRLLLVSALGGALLLASADILSRALSIHGEIPVGVITSLLGGPFFCFLLTRRPATGGTTL